MRGLDPRIHRIAGIASARCEDADGRIKSGHDNSELHKCHCALGSAPVANFPGQPCAKAEIWAPKSGRQPWTPAFASLSWGVTEVWPS